MVPLPLSITMGALWSVSVIVAEKGGLVRLGKWMVGLGYRWCGACLDGIDPKSFIGMIWDAIGSSVLRITSLRLRL